MWRFFFSPPLPLFLAIFMQLQEIIKSWLEVAEGWSERFWKAEGPYFHKMKIASTNFYFLMLFRTQNGIMQKFCLIWGENVGIPFGLQKGPNFISEVGNGKYGSWAFQNRPRNVAATSRSIFRIFQISPPMGENRPKSWFFGKNRKNPQKYQNPILR